MSRAITQAARLKPEVRLGIAISEFSASLTSEPRTAFKELQASEAPNAGDVARFTEEINSKGSRLHRSWKPYGTRVQGLLSQVQALAAAGDVMVGGSQNLIASGVWGVVRVSLTCILGYLSYFEKVSALLMRLGQSSAIHRELVQLFPHSAKLKVYTCEYLIVLVELCRKMVAHEAKGLVAQLAASLSIDKEFSDFEARLNAWAALINEKTMALNSKTILETRDSVSWLRRRAQERSEARADEDVARRLDLATRLSPRQDDFDRTWRRERKRGTVSWAFEREAFASWRQNHFGTHDTVLVVAGPLGSGKTVLMANIASRMQSQMESDTKDDAKDDTKNGTTDDTKEGANADTTDDTRDVVASFFCNRSDPASLEPEMILGSLAFQLVRALQEWRKSLDVEIQNRDADSITEFLERLVKQYRSDRHKCMEQTKVPQPTMPYVRLFVVLDGLDECRADDARLLIDTLCRWRRPCGVNLCLSARRYSPAMGIIQKTFPNGFGLLDTTDEQHKLELIGFIELELRRRPGFEDIDPKYQKLVQDTLCAGSAGMYLWAALQIDDLFPRYEATMTSETQWASVLDHLPTTLHDMFDRALGKATSVQHQPLIFQLVAAAAHPLSAAELRIALNVQPGSRTWNPATVVNFGELNRTLYACSGGLLEADEDDGSIYFVHHSVLTHLTNPDAPSPGPRFWFPLEKADLRMGEICLAYLDLEVHDRTVARVGAPDAAGKAADNVVQGVLEQSVRTSKIISMVRSRPCRSKAASVNVDIMEVADRLVREKKKSAARGIEDAEGFLAYAQAHWMQHSDHNLEQALDESIVRTIERPFVKAMRNMCTTATMFPWASNGPADALEWMQRHNHCRLFFFFLFNPWFLGDARGQTPNRSLDLFAGFKGNEKAGIMLPKRYAEDVDAEPWIRNYRDVSGWNQAELRIWPMVSEVWGEDQDGKRLDRAIECRRETGAPREITSILATLRRIRLRVGGDVTEVKDEPGKLSLNSGVARENSVPEEHQRRHKIRLPSYTLTVEWRSKNR